MRPTERVNFKDHVSKINSGDLLAWGRGSGSRASNFFVWFVRLCTFSFVGHVGIAWKVKGQLWVIEATFPFVRAIPVRTDQVFYHIPAPPGTKWDEEIEQFLLNLIGCVYSLMDCVRAGLGKTTSKDRNYQCAELAIEYYRRVGLTIKCRYTPIGIVKAILKMNSGKLIMVRPDQPGSKPLSKLTRIN